ncbi:MAG TPA: hypothetical protein VKE98_00790 [Gemmataceae bacterium]|nr:hypothetical protein [Gemmataceae bacterium]
MDNLVLAYTLVVVGLLLLAAELFLPTGGILFVLAIGALVVGVAMTFASSTSRGMVTLISVFVIIPIVGPILIHYWPKTPLGRRFFLAAQNEDDTLANMPVNLELEQLRGRIGRTLSDLRPSGVCDFDGQRVDTITEGMMVEAGGYVRCVDVRAGKVIVRPIEGPDANPLENLELT